MMIFVRESLWLMAVRTVDVAAQVLKNSWELARRNLNKEEIFLFIILFLILQI